MRRGTPAATLFGALLTVVRLAGTGSSMRRVAERIGTPAATVSQVEKGQRALKQSKIPAWAEALAVTDTDLLELWRLAQGLINVDGQTVFYRDRPEVLCEVPSEGAIADALSRRADLEPLYRLAAQITDVLGRMLPGVTLTIEPVGEYFEYPGYPGTPTDQDLYEIERWEETRDLPCIRCPAVGPPEHERTTEFADGELVEVPFIQELAPIVRRRGKSVDAADLEALIHELSAVERERVRGYVEAILENRPSQDD